MKKLVLVFLLISGWMGVMAQSDDGRSMQPIMKIAKPVIETIEEKSYEIVRMEFDILKDKKESYRTLYEGWTYNIIAFGDDRIADIDVEVYKKVDGEWVLIISDKEAKSSALVSLKPVSTGDYKIVIKAYKFNNGAAGGHYGMIIFHE